VSRGLIRIASIALAVVLLAYGCAPVNRDPKTLRLHEVGGWFVLYDDRYSFAPPFRWDDHDMAILDPDHHPDLREVPDRILLIAYVSVGQADPERDYWPQIEGRSWLISNEDSQDKKYLIDVRNVEWRSLLLETVIPRIVDEGFDGLFLDTLDAPIYLEDSFPKKYAGSKKALVELVREIRRRYPDLYLISNNAYELLPEMAPSLNAALAESVFSRKSQDGKGFEDTEAKKSGRKIRALKRGAIKKGLAVFNIEYSPPEDADRARRHRESSRRQGFKTYIAGANMDRVYPQL
jgi:uncharacterized protein (TIGR01370 family)